MAEPGNTDEKLTTVYGSGCLLTINPNREYDDKGTWLFIQKIFMRLVLSDYLLYCWQMKYDPNDHFFSPSEKQIREISDEFIVRGSPEVGEILDRLHLHVTINPFFHEGHVMFDLDMLRWRLAQLEKEVNTEMKKENKDWENITFNWYCFCKNRKIITAGDHNYLTKDKPVSKEIDIDTVYILPSGKKYKKSGLINKENGKWE